MSSLDQYLERNNYGTYYADIHGAYVDVPTSGDRQITAINRWLQTIYSANFKEVGPLNALGLYGYDLVNRPERVRQAVEILQSKVRRANELATDLPYYMRQRIGRWQYLVLSDRGDLHPLMQAVLLVNALSVVASDVHDILVNWSRLMAGKPHPFELGDIINSLATSTFKQREDAVHPTMSRGWYDMTRSALTNMSNGYVDQANAVLAGIAGVTWRDEVSEFSRAIAEYSNSKVSYSTPAQTCFDMLSHIGELAVRISGINADLLGEADLVQQVMSLRLIEKMTWRLVTTAADTCRVSDLTHPVPELEN